ncbi:MAG: LuxR C-terminal-related transcriptional regulator [Bacillus sp. (in: firmicutes)]
MHKQTLKDYMKAVASIKNAEERLEMMIRGCIEFFPFQRASLFSFSPINFIGEGIFQIEKNKMSTMTWLKQDIRTFPLVHYAIAHNQPLYIRNEKNQHTLPPEYEPYFDLTSLAIIPISTQDTVIGCAFIDRYTGDQPFNDMHLKQIFHYFQQLFNKLNQHKVQLSNREIEALQNLANGYTIKEMAVIMNISTFTARDYLTAAVRKLGVNHRAHAIAEAFRRGIIT